MPYTSNPKVTLIDEDGDAVKVTPEGKLEVSTELSGITIDGSQLSIDLDHDNDSVAVYGSPDNGVTKYPLKTSSDGSVVVEGINDAAFLDDAQASLDSINGKLTGAIQTNNGFGSLGITISAINGNQTGRSLFLFSSDNGTNNGLRVDPLHDAVITSHDEFAPGISAFHLSDEIGVEEKIYEVTIQASMDNYQPIRIGDSSVGVDIGLELYPGDGIVIPCRTTESVYLKGNNLTDQVQVTTLVGVAV